MKKLALITIVSLFLSSCSREPIETEKVCLRLYMIDGRVVDKPFVVPKGSKMSLYSIRGEYNLCNDARGIIKSGVVDFDYIKCQ